MFENYKKCLVCGMLARKRREAGWSEGGGGTAVAAGSRASYDYGDVMFWVTVALLVLLFVVGLLSILRVEYPARTVTLSSSPQQEAATEEVSQEEAKVEARKPAAADRLNERKQTVRTEVPQPQIRGMAPTRQLYRLSEETFEEKYAYMDSDKDMFDPKNNVIHARLYTRTYVIHIPKAVKTLKRPVPMLLCFHGMSRYVPRKQCCLLMFRPYI